MSNNGELKNLKKAIEHFLSIYLVKDLEWDVIAKYKSGINYLEINLANSVEWDKNYERLHNELVSFLKEWIKSNYKSVYKAALIENFSVKYILPTGDNNNDISKTVSLLKLPDYFKLYDLNDNESTSKKWLKKILEKKWFRYLLNIWYNLSLRYALIILSVLFPLLLFCFFYFLDNSAFQLRLKDSYGYISNASGIISSFMLIFIINKVSSIRSSKISHTTEIRKLSNQLTYFRSICYNLRRDHIFWSKDNDYISSYKYAESIKDKITFIQYQFPDFKNDAAMALWGSLYSKEECNSVVSLILQLHMFSDLEYTRSGLAYTKFPPNYIYSLSEVDEFSVFCEQNQIWICGTDTSLFPDTFQKSHFVKEIIEDYSHIYPDKTVIDEFTKNDLIDLSLDFQYKIIPQLIKKIEFVETPLPLVINYFTLMFILLLSFGVLIPTILFQFTASNLSYLSIFVAIGIILHIFLSLRSILKSENWLRNDTDYLL